LYLDGQNLSDHGTHKIATEILAQSRCLLKLTLSSNDIGSVGAEAILGALKANTTLQFLDLEQNYNLPVELKEQIGALLVRNRSLSALELGRYKIRKPPLHRSGRSKVSLVEDMANEGKVMVLKEMWEFERFKKEVFHRRGLDAQYVVELLGYHLPAGASIDGLQDGKLRPEKSVAGSYCLVLERADDTLRHVIENEQIAGHDFHVAFTIAFQLAHGLKHLHERGFCHMDLRQMNFMRVLNRWKLIDLDSSLAIHGQAVRSQSCYAPPEVLKLMHKEDTDLKVHTRMDVWSFGCVFYELCCDRSFWELEKGNDDLLYGENSLRQLMEWEGIDAERISHLFRKTKVPAARKELAIDLLSTCLKGNPLNRLQSMDDVLTHSFWDQPGRSCLELLKDADSRQRAVLGFALATLSCIMREYCQVLVDYTLDECKTKVRDEGMTWNQAVESLVRNGVKPKWCDINNNSSKQGPMRCSVCHRDFNEKEMIKWTEDRKPQIGDNVQVWVGGGDAPWADSKRVTHGVVLGLPGGVEVTVECVFKNQPVQMTKRLGFVRKLLEDESSTAESVACDHGLDPVTSTCRKRLVANSSCLKAALELVRQSLEQHGLVKEAALANNWGGIVIPPPSITDDMAAMVHYDFEIKQPFDLVKLFVPYNKAPYFASTWEAQDATNLLNLVDAITPRRENEIRRLCGRVKAIRNDWAHQVSMSVVEFMNAIDELSCFVDAVSSWEKLAGPVGNGVGADWEPVRRMRDSYLHDECV